MSRLPTYVPAPAKQLLNFIGDIEAPRGYDTIYGNNQNKLPKPLTSMTFGEIVDAQASWTKRFKSSAAGRYQFMRATLQGLAKEFPSDISGTTRFNPDLQDRLGYALLLRRGYASFVGGSIGINEFGKRLAQEWASLPVLADTKGAHRQVKRGQSYYAGDGLNKSLIAPAAVENILQIVLATAKQPAAPVPAPKPTQQPAQPPAVIERQPTQANWLEALLAALVKIFGGKKP